MKSVDTIARIRREFFIRGRLIKDIVLDLHVSRNTVRKVIRSGATTFAYEREVQPLPKLGPWRDDLDRMLATNVSRPSREQLTLIRVFEALCGLCLDPVRALIATVRPGRDIPCRAHFPAPAAHAEAFGSLVLRRARHDSRNDALTQIDRKG